MLLNARNCKKVIKGKKPLMIQQITKIFRLSNPDRKIFWVAQIFDSTLPNFRNGRAITPLPPVSYAYGFIFLLLDWLCKQK